MNGAYFEQGRQAGIADRMLGQDSPNAHSSVLAGYTEGYLHGKAGGDEVVRSPERDAAAMVKAFQDGGGTVLDMADLVKGRVKIPTREVPYAAERGPYNTTDAVLVYRGRRFAFVSTPKGSATRTTYQGPLVPGPHVECFALGSVITANPEMSTRAEMARLDAQGLVFLIDDGHEVEIDGSRYRVAQGPRGEGYTLPLLELVA